MLPMRMASTLKELICQLHHQFQKPSPNRLPTTPNLNRKHTQYLLDQVQLTPSNISNKDENNFVNWDEKQKSKFFVHSIFFFLLFIYFWSHSKKRNKLLLCDFVFSILTSTVVCVCVVCVYKIQYWFLFEINFFTKKSWNFIFSCKSSWKKFDFVLFLA